MIFRKLDEIGSALYRSIVFPFVRIYVELSTKSVMKQKTYINKGTVLKGKNFVGKGSYLSNTVLGYGSYVSDNGILRDIVIGKYCSIGTDLKCIGGAHPTDTFVSTHPAFYSTDNVTPLKYVSESKFEENKYVECDGGEPGKKYSCRIGNDVWIGSNVSLLQGVTIGDGCIVGTNSLVTKDLEPYGIYAGSPAKLIRKRFTDEQIDKLSKIKWWDKGEDWIKANIDKFTDIEQFLK